MSDIKTETAHREHFEEALKDGHAKLNRELLHWKTLAALAFMAGMIVGCVGTVVAWGAM